MCITIPGTPSGMMMCVSANPIKGTTVEWLRTPETDENLAQFSRSFTLKQNKPDPLNCEYNHVCAS